MHTLPSASPPFRLMLGLALTLLALATEGVRAQESAPAFRVIVNPQNPTTEVDRSFLSRAFLKRTTRWPHGTAISPVDLPFQSVVRRHFSDDVVGRSVSAVRNYWQQAIFSGRDIPPPELDNDAAVVRYVLRHPGAVGYVSPNASLQGARVLDVR